MMFLHLKQFFESGALGILTLPHLWKYTFSEAKAVTRTRRSMSSLTTVTQSCFKDNDIAVLHLLKPIW